MCNIYRNENVLVLHNPALLKLQDMRAKMYVQVEGCYHVAATALGSPLPLHMEHYACYNTPEIGRDFLRLQV